jgi:transcriptional regulator with XRE-family HTH domain
MHKQDVVFRQHPVAGRMDKQIFSKEQKVLVAYLREIRQKASLRQEDVAEQLKRPQSFVSKYESGERRLDVLELRQLCKVLGSPFVQVMTELDRRLRR